MTKPSYTKTWELREDPHQDHHERWVYYKNGIVSKDMNWHPFYNNVTSGHSHTSESTKPWPNGYPPRWTPQDRNHWEMTVDEAYGQNIWTPGSQWPSVDRRLWKVSGGWGSVFRSDGNASFWNVLESDKPNKDDLDNKIRIAMLDEFNAAVMMAESSVAVEMVTKRVQTLLNAARSLRRGDFNKAYNILGKPRKKHIKSAQRRSLRREFKDPIHQQFSQAFLELQYGWLPLCSDIHAAFEYVKTREPRMFVRASSKKDFSRTRSYETSSTIDGGRSFNTEKIWGSCRRAWTVEIRVNNRYLNEASRIGLTNPALVAWELVPFSFVVDWFLPIGDCLRAATPIFGVDVLGTLYTERLDYQTITTSTLKSAYPVDNASGAGQFGHKFHKYMRRTGYAVPSVKLPHFKNPISITHAANATALLIQTLKR